MEEKLKYFCIDLKCFYASVECIERGLDPFKTMLVVADEARGKGAICLAISPIMKMKGIKNRCRLFDIPKGMDYIIAKPRMKKYIEYSAMIYSIYLKYFSPDDIHIYSIDEAFIYCEPYLKLYQKNAYQLAKMVAGEVYSKTGIFATSGVGSNLYLAKVAMDILAKKSRDGMALLTTESYKRQLGDHTPLIDFWSVGPGIQNRLHRLGLFTMNDVASCNEDILYKEFGVNAQYLIDHSKGLEPATIKDIKEYVPESKSISNGETFDRNFTYEETILAFKELIDMTCLDLVSQKLVTNHIAFSVGYAINDYKNFTYKDYVSCAASHKLNVMTNSYDIISKELLEMFYEKVDKSKLIRRINVSFGNIQSEKYEYYDLFTDMDKINKEKSLQHAIVDLKDKYGKSSVIRGMDLDSNAQTLKRNKLIGGHNAE